MIQSQSYRYDFSVVMAVYNVEAYLHEAVDSLLHQTIGFSRIQLIMVDDGSTDNSGLICDEYKKRFPENIVVIHKENGGVSSARNAGLPLIEGKYVNFMDSDDKFARDAFKKVLYFFDKHNSETDVVAVPMIFFDGQTGEHQQNIKFATDADILHLFDTPYVTNLSASSSFIQTKCISGAEFDTRLKISEDAKFMLEILLDKMTLGLVPEAIYWYRRRSYGEESAIQSSQKKYEWYIPVLEFWLIWALDIAEKKYGNIPKFVQNEVMYDLQWKFRQKALPEDILDKPHQDEYKRLIFETLQRIDDDVIINQRNISPDLKLYLLSKKHDKEPQQHFITDERNKCRIEKNGGIQDFQEGDIEFRFANETVCKASEIKSVFEFIHIDRNSNICTIEGYHLINHLEKDAIIPYIEINGKYIECERIERPRKRGLCIGDYSNDVIGFRTAFFLTGFPMHVKSAISIGGIMVERNNIYHGPFFPLCSVYKNAYAILRNYLLAIEGNALIIKQKPSSLVLLDKETRFLLEIWKRNLLGGRKAVCGRILYHIIKPFKRKPLWLISDRIMKADDNGEALFRYLMDQMIKDISIIFSVSKKSPDYHRIAQYGKCVNAMSFQHKFLHLLCDVNISSHADAVTINPFSGHHNALRDLLTHQHFVFLQHGITKDDISDWLNRYDKDISGFVTAAYKEYASIVEGNYDYISSKIWLTGFPRFDRLYHNEKKAITIMPTWRRYLMADIDSKTGEWTVKKSFIYSKFYLFYNELINSERLIIALKEAGYSLQFFPHPNVQPSIDLFDHNPDVTFLNRNTSYRDVYAQSNLVVTDYSSAVFDFAYLRKPIIYCQFDKEEFFSGDHVYSKGYFDYERDGFGEVVYDLESTIDLIIQYVENNCSLSDKYRSRIDGFFAFNDRNNCQRVVDKIMQLTEKQ